MTSSQFLDGGGRRRRSRQATIVAWHCLVLPFFSKLMIFTISITILLYYFMKIQNGMGFYVVFTVFFSVGPPPPPKKKTINSEICQSFSNVTTKMFLNSYSRTHCTSHSQHLQLLFAAIFFMVL